MCLATNWQLREQDRFDDNTYQPVPAINGLTYPPEHYVHLSVKDTESDFVAYTPSQEYGERDRQVRLKFGKYLRKAIPTLTDAEIQTAVNELRSKLALASQPATLLFATDRETINHIFETEMCACDSTYTSCMHGKFDGDTNRPYHVYADSPDVAVAYVRANGQIVSRSVVSTKDKTWIRTYSCRYGDSATDCQTLKTLLAKASYVKGELYGNRLTLLPSKYGSPMLPYIDNGGLEVTSTGSYWEVVREGQGEYVADCTDGTATEAGERCESCERLTDDCECIYCECCEERFQGRCDRCSMCEVCEGCIEHSGCSCSRCSHCNEIISTSRRGITTCECDRCGECGELEDNGDCECSKCDDCNQLEENCECRKCDECEEKTQDCTCVTKEDTDDETTITADVTRDVTLPASSAI